MDKTDFLRLVVLWCLCIGVWKILIVSAFHIDYGHRIPAVWSSVAAAAKAAASAAAAAAGAAETAHSSSDCGQPTEPFFEHDYDTTIGKRVVGGNPTTTGAFPWTVLLKRYGFNSVLCTGAILSNRLVLTAAHCFDNLRFGDVYLWVGKDEVDDYRLRGLVYVEDFILHPAYNPATKTNDIALLRTVRNISFNSNVRPVCLPDHLTLMPPTDFCFLAGYGDTLGTGVERRLNFIRVPLVNSSLCAQEDWLGEAFQKIMNVSFCAGYADGGPDACMGDSGAALVCPHPTDSKYYVYGVASWGKGCGETKKPGVYTRVPDFLPWINDYLQPPQ